MRARGPRMSSHILVFLAKVQLQRGPGALDFQLVFREESVVLRAPETRVPLEHRCIGHNSRTLGTGHGRSCYIASVPATFRLRPQLRQLAGGLDSGTAVLVLPRPEPRLPRTAGLGDNDDLFSATLFRVRLPRWPEAVAGALDWVAERVVLPECGARLRVSALRLRVGAGAMAGDVDGPQDRVVLSACGRQLHLLGVQRGVSRLPHWQ